MEGEKCDWEDIKKVVTASALCDEEDPIDKAFKVRYAYATRVACARWIFVAV